MLGHRLWPRWRLPLALLPCGSGAVWNRLQNSQGACQPQGSTWSSSLPLQVINLAVADTGGALADVFPLKAVHPLLQHLLLLCQVVHIKDLAVNFHGIGPCLDAMYSIRFAWRDGQQQHGLGTAEDKGYISSCQCQAWCAAVVRRRWCHSASATKSPWIGYSRGEGVHRATDRC